METKEIINKLVDWVDTEEEASRLINDIISSIYEKMHDKGKHILANKYVGVEFDDNFDFGNFEVSKTMNLYRAYLHAAALNSFHLACIAEIDKKSLLLDIKEDLEILCEDYGDLSTDNKGGK